MRLARCLLPLTAVLAGTAVAKDRPRIAVLALEGSDVRPELLAALNAVVPSELRRREPDAHVIAGAELGTMMQLERQKQLLGCSDDSSCMAEVAGALGAEKLFGGTVARAPAGHVLELRLIDNRRAGGTVSVSRLVPREDQLVEELKGAIGELLWIASPKEPRVVALSAALLGLGAVLTAGGGAGIVYSLKVNGDYVRQQDPAVVPEPTVSRADAQLVKTLYPLSWVATGVGLLTAGFGTWGLLSRGELRPGVALSVGPSSVTLVGVF